MENYNEKIGCWFCIRKNNHGCINTTLCDKFIPDWNVVPDTLVDDVQEVSEW